MSLFEFPAHNIGAASASNADSIYVKTKSACILRYSPGGDELARLPAQTRLLALDFDGQHWKVVYGSKVGFLMNLDIASSQLDRERIQLRVDVEDKVRSALRDSLNAVSVEKLRAFDQARTALMQERFWVSAATTNVRSSPDAASEVITTLSRDQSVYVQECQSEWCLVVFDGPFRTSLSSAIKEYHSVTEYEHAYRRGWIHQSLLSTRSPYERQVQREIDAVGARRRAFVDGNPSLSQREREAILSGNVILGMSAEMVHASIGSPKDINRSVGSWGVHEQWVYPDYVFLYFENGKLTSWQD